MIKANQPIEEISQPLYTYRLDLHISGANLPFRCFLRFFQRNIFTRNNWVLFTATEVSEDTSNPQYKTNIQFDYIFSVQQEIRVEAVTGEYDFIGYAEFKFANLLNAANQTLPLLLHKGTTQGNEESYVVIKCDNFSDNTDEVRLSLGANFLKSFVFKPRTYISVWKREDDQKYTSLARSDSVDSNVPMWEPVKLKMKDICKKENSRLLRVVIHQIPKMGQEKIMGHAEITYQQIFKEDVKTFQIVKFSRKDEKKVLTKEVGTLFVQQKETIYDHQFIDYLFGGLDILSAIAIDFSKIVFSEPSGTGGRGESHIRLVENSFSYIADVLAPYHLSKTVGFLGFGAQDSSEESNKSPSECFTMKGNSENNNFSSSREAIKAYRETLLQSNYKSQPKRNLTNVIKSIVAEFRKDLFFSSNLRYFTITLIIEEADEDIQELVNYLVPLSNEMPLTIFLVGIGKGSFQALECFEIYSKREYLKDSKGDILSISTLNFLNFETIGNNGGNLAKELLKIIPSRVTSYMKRHKDKPMMKQPNTVWKKNTIFGPLRNTSKEIEDANIVVTNMQPTSHKTNGSKGIFDKMF